MRAARRKKAPPRSGAKLELRGTTQFRQSALWPLVPVTEDRPFAPTGLSARKLRSELRPYPRPARFQPRASNRFNSRPARLSGEPYAGYSLHHSSIVNYHSTFLSKKQCFKGYFMVNRSLKPPQMPSLNIISHPFY